MPTEAPTWEDTLPEPSWEDTEPFQAGPPTLINPELRQSQDLQTTTRGGPRVSLPDADVARATFRESVGEGYGEVVTHPGIELPSFAPSLETVQKALDVTRAASDYETSGTIPNVPTEPSKPTTAAKVITGGLEGVDELTRGVVGFFTSGPGALQLVASRTPLAPAVYAKWTLDMLNAGFTSAKDAWDAFQKSDYRKASKDAAVAFGSFLGAGAAARHGYKELAPVIDAVPRGDLQGVRVEEAQQKALEANMPAQDKAAPVGVGLEPKAFLFEEAAREAEQPKPQEPIAAKEPSTVKESLPVEPIPESPAPAVPTPPKTEAAVEKAAVSNVPEPKIEGMGGAIPEEFKPNLQTPTGIKNAAMEKELASLGLPPLVKINRQSNQATWDRTMARIDRDPAWQDRLVEELKKEPRQINAEEVFALDHRLVDLKIEYTKATREAAQEYADGRLDFAKEAGQRAQYWSEKILELSKVTKEVGREWGLAGQARQRMMNEDYSLAGLTVDRLTRLGRELTPEEKAEVQKIAEDAAKASEAVAKREAEVEAREREIEAKEIAARAAAEATAEAPSPYVVKLVESIVKDWDSRADRARARLREKMARTSAGVDPTILVDLSEIGLSHLGHAGLNFAKWSTRMLADVGEWAKPHLEEVFKRSQKLAEADVAKRAGPKKEEVKKAIGRPTPVEAIDGIVTRVGKRFAKNPQLDFSMAARKIARYYVEQGITKPLELVDAVHAKLVEVMPELTKRETMDALSGYGRFMPLKKDAVSVALRDATGQMQQIAKLEDMAAGIAPKKSGPERRVPTDEERRLIKQVEEKKKEGGYDVTDPETQLRTAMQAAERRLNNQISDLNHQIVTRTKIVKNKRKLELDDNLKALKAKRDFLKEVYDEVFAPAPLTNAQRLAKWKERTQDKIAEYRERLSERDFKPRKRPIPPRLDMEAIKLRYQLHKVHAALMDMRLKDELKQRTRARKIVDGVANLIRFSRAVMTGGEFSAVFRQGGFTLFSHPVIGTKALKQMFQALMSEEAQFRINEEIQTRPNAPLYERNGLEFTESGVRLSTMEEHYMFRVSERIGKNPLAKYPIKFINAFQRAYTTYLNRIRADTFDVLLDKWGDSPEMQKQIANLINVSTGRGSKGVGKFVGEGMNTVFFAPRYSISRIQLLTMQPMWKGNLETRKMVAAEYAKVLVGATVVYSLAAMMGGEIEDDPRSTDFGKIKFGNTRIDPLFGLIQWTVLMAREFSGTTVNKKGKVRPLREVYRIGGKLPKRTAVEPTGLTIAGRFALNKFAPVPGVGARFVAGEDMTGVKFNLKDEITNALSPITYGDIYDAMQEQGVPKGMAISVLAMFGMGVQTYDANAKRKD